MLKILLTVAALSAPEVVLGQSVQAPLWSGHAFTRGAGTTGSSAKAPGRFSGRLISSTFFRILPAGQASGVAFRPKWKSGQDWLVNSGVAALSGTGWLASRPWMEDSKGFTARSFGAQPLARPLTTADNWLGGPGNWSNVGLWSTGAIPVASNDVFINNSSPVSEVQLDVSATIDNLTVGSTSSLDFANGVSLTVGASGGNTISNAGTISLNSSGGGAYLIIGSANVTLSGGGAGTPSMLTMSNSSSNIIEGAVSTDTLTNQETIQGSGNIGGASLKLVNSGTINANQNVALTVEPTSGGLTNSGTMEASNAGTLVVEASGAATNSGVIEADASSIVQVIGGTYTNTSGSIQNAGDMLLEDVTINGGTVSQSGAGYMQLYGANINTAVTNSGSGTIEVLNGPGSSVGALTNPTGGLVTIDNGGVLTLTGAVSNAGTIAMNSAGGGAYLTIGAANVTLNGGGTLTMSSNSSNIIDGAASTDTLTNQETIQGSGNIGDASLKLTNSGTINANQNVALTVEPTTGGLTNSGTMEATNTGTLVVEASGAATNSGVIEAASNSILQMIGGTYTDTNGTIQNNAGNMLLENLTINGGTVSQTGAASMQLYGATINAPVSNSSAGTIEVLNGPGSSVGPLTNPAGGQVTIDNGGVLTLTGAVNNDGSMIMNSAGGGAYLTIGAANVTLSGGGTLTMSSNGSNIIDGAASTDTLTNQETIQGSGNIGDASLKLTNSGTINANQNVALTVEPTTGGLTNSGTMEATNTGTLVVEASGAATNSGAIEAASNSILQMIGGTYTDTNGTIQNNAGNMLLENLTINGGTVSQTGAASMQLYGATINAPVSNSSAGTIEVLNGPGSSVGPLTNPAGGQVTIDNGGVLTLTGAVSNAGAIAMNSAGGGAYLTIGAANVTLNGGGTLTMSSNSSNIIDGAASSDTLTNQEAIQGSGNIGDASLKLTNSGTINANQNVALTVEPTTGGLTNSGTMEATNTGTLVVEASGAATNSGVIEAASNSILQMIGGTYTDTNGTIQNNAGNMLLENLTINGGTVSQTGAASMQLYGATINAPVSNSSAGTIEVLNGPGSSVGPLINPAGGQVTIDNGGVLTLTGAVNNDGSIIMNSAGGGAYLTIGAANVTLSGGGTLTMSSNGSNIIDGAASTDTLTNQETIQGSGNIGDASLKLTNSGTINANQNVALTIEPVSGGLTNTGTLEATNTATLLVEASGAATNTGTIEAATGSTLEIVGGTYTNTNGTIQNAGNMLLQNVSINGGTVSQTGAADMQLSGANINTTVTNSATGTIEALNGTNNTINKLTNPAGGQLLIDSGAILTLTQATSDAGAIDVNGTLDTKGSLTLTGSAGITLANGSVAAIGTSDTLTIAKTSTVQGTGAISNFGIANSGTLSSNVSTLTILPTSAGLNNKDTISVSAGDIMQIGNGSSVSLTNLLGTTLTGGTYDISGTLQFGPSGTTIATNAAKITLSGGQIIDYGGNNVLAGLTTNAATGTFTLSSGEPLTTSGGNFTNAGAFTVSKGTTFSVGGSGFNLTQTAGSTTVAGTLTSTSLGTVSVDGGTLSGAGTVADNLVDDSTLDPG